MRSLVDKLLHLSWITGMSGCSKRKPGEVFHRLNNEEREICKELKAEDFNHPSCVYDERKVREILKR